MIKERTPFKNIFIQPNAGDAGGAMGSALHFLKNSQFVKDKEQQIGPNKCYLGSSYSNEYIEETLIKNNKLVKEYSFKKMNDEDLYKEVASRISKNGVHEL